jgi:hypothetical protein
MVGAWFSPGIPASSTTKSGRHDIANILLKVALNTKNQIKSNQILIVAKNTLVALSGVDILGCTYLSVRPSKRPSHVWFDDLIKQSEIIMEFVKPLNTA